MNSHRSTRLPQYDNGTIACISPGYQAIENCPGSLLVESGLPSLADEGLQTNYHDLPVELMSWQRHSSIEVWYFCAKRFAGSHWSFTWFTLSRPPERLQWLAGSSSSGLTVISWARYTCSPSLKLTGPQYILWNIYILSLWRILNQAWSYVLLWALCRSLTTSQLRVKRMSLFPGVSTLRR